MITQLNCSFGPVYFIYGVDSNKIGKELDKIFVKGHDYSGNDRPVSGNAFTMDGVGGSRRFFMWIDHKMNKNDKITVLVHELIHVVTFISQYVGTNLDDSCGEWTAYLLEDLLEQSLKVINKKTKKKKVCGNRQTK